MASTPQHFGYAVCEHAKLVVPVTSYYASKSAALRALPEAVARELGAEVTLCELFPASQHEGARELVDSLAADSWGYSVTPEVSLVPNAQRLEAAAYREHCETPTTCVGLDASQCIALLGSWGVPARMSKGGTVWALAPESAGLASKGLRWSPKRSQWWIKPGSAGDATPMPCKLADFSTAA